MSSDNEDSTNNVLNDTIVSTTSEDMSTEVENHYRENNGNIFEVFNYDQYGRAYYKNKNDGMIYCYNYMFKCFELMLPQSPIVNPEIFFNNGFEDRTSTPTVLQTLPSYNDDIQRDEETMENNSPFYNILTECNNHIKNKSTYEFCLPFNITNKQIEQFKNYLNKWNAYLVKIELINCYFFGVYFSITSIPKHVMLKLQKNYIIDEVSAITKQPVVDFVKSEIYYTNNKIYLRNCLSDETYGNLQEKSIIVINIGIQEYIYECSYNIDGGKKHYYFSANIEGNDTSAPAFDLHMLRDGNTILNNYYYSDSSGTKHFVSKLLMIICESGKSSLNINGVHTYFSRFTIETPNDRFD